MRVLNGKKRSFAKFICASLGILGGGLGFGIVQPDRAQASRTQISVRAVLHGLPKAELTWLDVVETRGGSVALLQALREATFKSPDELTLTGQTSGGQAREIIFSQTELRKEWQKLIFSRPAVREERAQLILPGQLAVRLSKDFWYQDLNRQIARRMNGQNQYSQIQTDLDMTRVKSEDLQPPYWDFANLKLGSQMISIFGASGKKWLSVNVRVFRKVWVASRSLRQGEPLGPSLVEQREVEVTFRDDFVTSESLDGMTLKRSLPAQTPLMINDLQRVKLIRYGQAIEIAMGDEIHNIRVRGIAQRDGARGDRIPVLIVDTKKIIEVKVESASEVIVE